MSCIGGVVSCIGGGIIFNEGGSWGWGRRSSPLRFYDDSYSLFLFRQGVGVGWAGSVSNSWRYRTRLLL